MNTEERVDKLRAEVDCLREEIKGLKITSSPEKKKKKVRDPNAEKRSPSLYNLHIADFIAKAKAAALEKGVKFDHKDTFKAAAADWGAKKESKP